MRRLMVVVTLILCLSCPILAGHTQTGFGRQCECNPVGDICQCCGASLLTVTPNQENDSITQHDSDGTGPMLELSVIRMAFLMWLKVKA